MRFQSIFMKFRSETSGVFLKEKLLFGELNVISASFMWLDYVLQSLITPFGDMTKNLAW